jgi:hypothetical protein
MAILCEIVEPFHIGGQAFVPGTVTELPDHEIPGLIESGKVKQMLTANIGPVDDEPQPVRKRGKAA